MRELISALEKKKKAQTGNELSNILSKSSHARKKPPCTQHLPACQVEITVGDSDLCCCALCPLSAINYLCFFILHRRSTPHAVSDYKSDYIVPPNVRPQGRAKSASSFDR